MSGTSLTAFLAAAALAPLLVYGHHLLRRIRSRGYRHWRQQRAAAARTGDVKQAGLRTGRPAPDFALPRIGGGECSLGEFRGKRVLVAFTESGCATGERIAAELNRQQHSGNVQVLVIHHGARHEAAVWADHVLAACPVLVQSDGEISKRYRVAGTPSAFVIDEQGIIAASGAISEPRFLRYLLAAVSDEEPCRRGSGHFRGTVPGRRTRHSLSASAGCGRPHAVFSGKRPLPAPGADRPGRNGSGLPGPPHASQSRRGA